MWKLIVLIVVFLFCVFAQVMWISVIQPEVTADFALAQMGPNSTNTAAQTVRGWHWFQNTVMTILWTGFFLLGISMYWKEILKMKKFVMSMMLFTTLMLSGCIAPYDTPVFVTVGNSEEAFLIKNEGEAKQASTKSIEYLTKNRVQAKRIQIPYRWQDMGRGWYNGKYLPEAQLIIVDRAACTRKWTADDHVGTSNKNEAIWVESSDSVNFSTGIEVVAKILTEEDAVKFLFNYPASKEVVIKSNNSYKDDYVVKTVGLDQILDMEIRSVVQRVFSEEAAKYTMDEGRTKKGDIMKKVTDETIKYATERGITITSIAQFGGFTYNNKEIQAAIDKVFQAQQDKAVAKAEFDAAQERKNALQAKGEGEASQKVAAAQGEADAIKLVADAKAYELKQLQENPEAYLALKQFEIQTKMYSTWNGQMPTYLMGSGQGVSMLLPTPPVLTNPTKK